MFRHIFGPPRQDRQAVEREKRITELDGHITRLTEQNIRLSLRNVELVAFLEALDFNKLKGAAELRKQRDALVKKVENLDPMLVDCPYCHGAHYTGQRCPLDPQQ